MRCFPVKTVNIVGGGLAGLSLGLALRQRDIPTTIVESGGYPRHKVCGEFISGKGVSLLRTLGVEGRLRELGLTSAQEVQFFLDGDGSPRVPLPAAAWCLSRWNLDLALAEAFEQQGGRIRKHSRGDVSEMKPGWVQASGRRRASHARARWVGVKFHLSQFSLKADLEMHLQNGAYVGICGVEGERSNVCALMPKERVPSRLSSDPLAGLGRVFSATLGERLSHAQLVSGSLSTVAGLDYSERTPTDDSSVHLGDAQGLIPPITGNGMSLAFESAALAIAPLSQWSRDLISWEAASREIRLRQRSAFSFRLLRARCLQRFLVSDALRMGRRWVLPAFPRLVPWAFRLTR